jgi:tetratricopeptide (TPR) repeat protein
MDRDSATVRLCVEGIQAETADRTDDARLHFAQAWEQRQDDYDACVAAHYVARHQATPQEALRWNQEALDRADALNDASVHGFYPSLYLNMGKAYEDVGNREQARRYYELAATKLGGLPEGKYGDVVRDAVERGLRRIG